LPRRSLDRITLSGVQLLPRLGTTEEERRNPQPCEADITFWGDFEAAASTDSPDKAIDYSRVLARAVTTAESGEYKLIETLAYRLARTVLQEFPAFKVVIRLRKRPLSLSGKLDFVEIELEES
jgi:7,8-dihydroneopterin aldolase/epimerase/oxygenase